MNVWQRYVTRNPMKAETRRSFRRFFGIGKMSEKAVKFGGGLFGFMYLLIVWIFWEYMREVDSSVWVNFETAIFMLIGSIGFYTAISGERERRTWDVLRSLPVTRGQIVVGKFIGAVVVLSVVWLVLLPFNLISAAMDTSSNIAHFSVMARLGIDLEAYLVAYLTGILSLSITLFLSARARSSISALSSSLVTLFLWVAVWPMVLSMWVSSDPKWDFRWKVSMNPFVTVARVFDQTTMFTPFLIYAAVSLVLSLVLVVCTEQTLSRAEDRIEFVSQTKHA